ncbi:hypothetical protein PHLGIDRAFT_24357 [Phlebiopsis gigantea 11061_1 CR5-6]|uniref:DUF6534 domain-containing protein n=1 Tax=Phlebiopsis gigantea (strain 11061_1 CR5-6) TaxID=745531 RepID=A0A0C3NP64_PHLG1|nr:hypothetical protein PHLGIDRAFT_24357 [Phlebiopsis gigantea 11061_1 CR5-6]
MVEATIPIPAGLPTTFDNTWGAAMIGGFITAVLYGVMLVQIWMFFRRSQGEGPFMRASVRTHLLNTMHLICIIHALYRFMVSNFLNPLALIEKTPWSVMVVFFTAATDVLVQCWFTFRVHRLSKGNWWLTVILGCLTITVLGNSVGVFQLATFPEFAKANWVVYLGLAFTVTTDLIIALALCYYLRRMRSGSFHRTESMITNLMVYAVNTGLLTSLLCIACIVARVTQPNNFIFIGLFFPLSSLYSNALLGSLNARDWFRTGSDALTIPLGSISSGSGRNRTQPIAPIAFRHETDTYKEDPGTGPQLSVQVNTDVVKATL